MTLDQLLDEKQTIISLLRDSCISLNTYMELMDVNDLQIHLLCLKIK